jgi:gliding motility-associated-like protein
MKKMLLIFALIASCLNAQIPLTVSYRLSEPNCQLGAVKIHVDGGVPPYLITWSNGGVGDTMSSLAGGHYGVHVKDDDTSQADIEFDVAAYSCTVHANNVFTPNGDAINDTWSVGGTENFPNFLLQVFDRWGQLVHQQRHTYVPWDGTHLGLKLSEATYYYIFFFDADKQKDFVNGSVTIVR